MNRGLVLVEDTERHRSLLETAGEFAAGSDAELVLLSTLTEDEYQDNRAALQPVEDIEGTTYGIDTATERLERLAREIAADALADSDVDYRIVPRVVDGNSIADEILAVADENDCDHVFVVGRRRSPTGKAIFGDVAQSVILGFDGRVTVDLE